ncbi:MAG TPA: peptidase, partial [Alcanivorax sp.]|nr:peptidase [Alcanivorax sp.]
MQQSTIRAWSAVHKWTSLICTAFMLMLCLTGLPLIFHDEIDAALDDSTWQPA